MRCLPALLTTLLLFLSAVPAEADDFEFDIADGPYEPARESFAEHFECPEWFRDAKFGIYMHWGLNSVPGFDGHYARFMYHQQKPEQAKRDDEAKAKSPGKYVRAYSGWKPGGDQVYRYHVEKFGHPSKFGYKDFIPLFTADKFDADELATFYKEIGAKYVGVMAVHHDNFDLFDSTHQPWNSVNMGPKLDVVGAWKEACQRHGLRLAVTNHMNDGHDHVFFQGETDSFGPLKGVPYDTLDPANDGLYGKRGKDRIRIDQPGHSQQWYLRIKELVDKYDPDLVFLDGGLNHGEYGKHFVAHYYNQSIQRNGELEAIVTIKAGHRGRSVPGFVQDVESGTISKLQANPWQVDTTLNPGWFYLGDTIGTVGGGEAGLAEGETSGPIKVEGGADRVRLTGASVIDNLIDTVSKNGTMLLNVGLRPDGSLPETFRKELRIVGDWLAVNGESIYDTRPWTVFGEGPTEPDFSQAYNDANIRFTAEDIRFTTKGDTLYATLLDWPGDAAEFTFAQVTEESFRMPKSVTMLATGEALKWKISADGLEVTFPSKQPGDYAYVVKVE